MRANRPDDVAKWLTFLSLCQHFIYTAAKYLFDFLFCGRAIGLRRDPQTVAMLGFFPRDLVGRQPVCVERFAPARHQIIPFSQQCSESRKCAPRVFIVLPARVRTMERG